MQASAEYTGVIGAASGDVKCRMFAGQFIPRYAASFPSLFAKALAAQLAMLSDEDAGVKVNAVRNLPSLLSGEHMTGENVQIAAAALVPQLGSDVASEVHAASEVLDSLLAADAKEVATAVFARLTGGDAEEEAVRAKYFDFLRAKVLPVVVKAPEETRDALEQHVVSLVKNALVDVTTAEFRKYLGLLRRLQLAPVSTRTVVSARVAVTLGIALVQMAIFLGLAAAAFGLQLSGAWWAAVPLLVVGTLCFMAVGLLAGALARTTEGAVNAANFMVLPMAFLSGSFFPLDGAPTWLQRLSDLLPLKHLNEGMLDVMVRGEGASAALAPMAVLAGFAVVITLLAARLFRWETV